MCVDAQGEIGHSLMCVDEAVEFCAGLTPKVSQELLHGAACVLRAVKPVIRRQRKRARGTGLFGIVEDYRFCRVSWTAA